MLTYITLDDENFVEYLMTEECMDELGRAILRRDELVNMYDVNMGQYYGSLDVKFMLTAQKSLDSYLKILYNRAMSLKNLLAMCQTTYVIIEG